LIFEDFDFPTVSSTLSPIPSNQIEANGKFPIIIPRHCILEDIATRQKTMTETENNDVKRKR
jgi:hypothetical protein